MYLGVNGDDDDVDIRGLLGGGGSVWLALCKDIKFYIVNIITYESDIYDESSLLSGVFRSRRHSVI